MEKVPQFRVFLKYNRRLQSLKDKFPDGIPCLEFLALDRSKIVPKKFVFVCDEELTDEAERAFIYDAFNLTVPHYRGANKVGRTAIPLTEVIKVVDFQGKTPPLELLKQFWIINNQVFKIEKARFELSGPNIHILIMGLQQALLIEPDGEPNFNDFFVGQACSLIKLVTENNPILKGYFIDAFPYEYQD